MKSLISTDHIKNHIFVLRGYKVMLDSDLAVLYGVETRALVQAVKRNRDRFPADFMFQLDNQEFSTLRSQTVISNKGRGGRRYLPYAFTEQGVAMLSTVLDSKQAIQVNIAIMRVFVRLRELASTHKELMVKLEDLERRIQKHDTHIQEIFDAIYQLMAPPEKHKPIVGFK